MPPREALLRRIPKVDAVLSSPAARALLRSQPRWVVVEGVRHALARLRREMSEGPAEAWNAPGLIESRLEGYVRGAVARTGQTSLRSVINATGVVLHTNLGRAVLAEAAVRAVEEAARRYTNLEFRLEEGARGDRTRHVEGWLQRLTGAEAACVVNNNAGAVLLALNSLAEGREVVVSRGELVEIGGGFRLPDVMRKSGARLREVGTTNRTRVEDYREALNEATGLLLKVHRSNFALVGYTEDVPAASLVPLGRDRAIPVMEDLGSGCLVPRGPRTAIYDREPRPGDAVAAGVGVATFSGDKLLGGPQAGVAVGRRDLIDRLRRNPLHRALRIDKLSLAALEATLRLYLEGEAGWEALPAVRQLLEPADRVARRARRLMRSLSPEIRKAAQARVVRDVSEAGGGALAGVGLSTAALALRPERMSPTELEERLRRGQPPVLARIREGAVLLDCRTVQDDEVRPLAQALQRGLAPAPDSV